MSFQQTLRNITILFIINMNMNERYLHIKKNRTTPKTKYSVYEKLERFFALKYKLLFKKKFYLNKYYSFQINIPQNKQKEKNQ